MKFNKLEQGYFIKLSENKNIELEWSTDAQWFWFSGGINTGDHWGFELYVSILKVDLRFTFYDTRHRED